VQRLQRDWLVESRPYRSIFLTEDGRAIAEMSRLATGSLRFS
jgi:Mn-dependent DtxR family transcriptional regulator